MALEQERKFLANNFPHFNGEGEITIFQMYMVDRPDHSLRIRILYDKVNHTKESTICYKYYLDAESKEEHEFSFDSSIASNIYLKKEYDSVLIKRRLGY